MSTTPKSALSGSTYLANPSHWGGLTAEKAHAQIYYQCPADVLHLKGASTQKEHWTNPFQTGLCCHEW